MSAPVGDMPRHLVHRLREALVPVLTEGNWQQIEEDHKRVGLPWRSDFNPGWGKPKYVKQVLDDLQDEEVVAVARRVLDCFPDRRAFAVEDALLWIDSNGIARISEVTRLGFAKALEGRRLHPRESASDVLGKFAWASNDHWFEYAGLGDIYDFETDPLAFLDAYGFRKWPDARLFQLVEFLVHPTVRQGDEQTSLIHLLNDLFVADGFKLAESEQLSGHPVFKVRRVTAGVAGRPKNLIFASTGPKPELGFVDAVNNDIAILRHAEHCLVYDEPIGDVGLWWSKLVEWWAAREGLDPSEPSTRKGLADRLMKSLGSEPERRMFTAYFKAFRPWLGDALPALVPQVYLHYDPMTLRELRARGDQRRFDVQRMDFLLLLPHSVRVVIEIDGQQHYSTGAEPSAKPSPEEYARTARGDRFLRLAGYEVYRFGGYELRDERACESAVDDFFTQLFRRHGLLDSS